ncbi:hypothetical protein ANN_13945 [Periplaneta americana]|uniref:Uncharacterized protein n=1 Tax=Periplaneta americana TaxID=6978 RepID=A0ABQ8SW61_PERAM|nr:hypothetical protein ANN_13945 [Periplaneta americana]
MPTGASARFRAQESLSALQRKEKRQKKESVTIQYIDLCDKMVHTKIPFRTLDNPHFRSFLEKYTNQHIPGEATMRKEYLPISYQNTIAKIRESVNDQKIYGFQFISLQTISEHERDSSKVNVFCALSQRKLYGPFFFIEATVTGHSYLDMLEQRLVPQIRQDLDDDFIFQQDGTPPHFHNAVRAYLNTEMSDRWIGRAGVRDRCFMTWPPRSPDMTACDFFL